MPTDEVLLTTLCKAEEIQYLPLLTKLSKDLNDMQTHASNHLILQNRDQSIYRLNVEVETGPAFGTVKWHTPRKDLIAKEAF